MTATLEEPQTEPTHDNTSSSSDRDDSQAIADDVGQRGRRLRHEMAAVRLSFHWPGVRKTLTPGQRATAADAFGAAGPFVSAGKKLVDTTHPSWKACTVVRSQAQKFLHGMTVPWPEPGVRLIRRDDVEAFDVRMTVLSSELSHAADRLADDFEELKRQAAERLGDLFDSSHYPTNVAAGFGIEWDFPAVEAPAYLRDLCPSLYREEHQRIAARFEEAARLAETAFTEELANLVEHLSERLTGSVDAKPKVFRDTAVENLTAFFDRFRRLNIAGSRDLERIVDRAQGLLTGVEPRDLRRSESARQTIAAGLTRVQSQLDGLLVDRPRRRVIR